MFIDNLFLLDNFIINYFQSYKKLREVIIPSPSTETPRTKKFNRLIATLRFENEKTLRLLSKKVTQLSMDFAQVRKRNISTLKKIKYSFTFVINKFTI